MKKAKGDYRVGVGASSVLMILVVLAMTALGLLSLGSARQTESQTARNVQTARDYYTAAAEAQRTLADIDAAAVSNAAWGQSASVDADWLDAQDIGARFEKGDGDTARFELIVPAGEEHELVVRGTLSATGAKRLLLTEHALVSTYMPDEGADFVLMGE